MAGDVRAMVRLVDELLWVLRRGGLVIATSQAIDAVRAVRAVGFASRDTVREALAAVVVTRRSDRARFDTAFDAFFARMPRATLWERLAARGFTEIEIAVLRETLEDLREAGSHLGAFLSGGAELDRLLELSSMSRVLDGLTSRLQTGFFVHKMLDAIGAPQAKGALASLANRLGDALPKERADALSRALEAELQQVEVATREHIERRHARREAEDAARAGSNDVRDKPLVALDAVESEEIRRAVRAFAMRLRGGERVRRKRGRRGQVDPQGTRRLSRRTDFVPLVLARRGRRRDRPELFVLCDVSESVRAVATFMLELAYAMQSLFARTRTFVFVSDLAETTPLFEREPPERALASAYSGALVPITSNSSYGRALRAFEARHMQDVTRRATVVILGDGRTNYQDAGADVLDRIRGRARALVWLCPEPRSAWASGDSAMARYALRCTKVLDVRSARELEDAARSLAFLR